MRIKIISVIICILFLFCLLPSIKAQNNGDADVLEQRIDEIEATDIDTLSLSVKKIYKETLLRLYESYIAAADEQIQSLTKLEKISDPEGKFANRRKEYEQKKDQTQKKINLLRENALVVDPVVNPKLEVKPPLDPKKADAQVVVKEKKDTVAAQIPKFTKEDVEKSSFADAPEGLKYQAELLAKGIVQNINKAGIVEKRVSGEISSLFSLSVVTGFNPDRAKNSIYNLEPIRFLVETGRTDKQLGSSSGTSASTSKIDKAGFPWLLGFAIENGYIENDVQDTVMTLSTSPAAFFSLTEPNATEAYRKSGFFNKIGVSASFNINSENPLLENATRSQLREYSIKYRFLGDRSSRSPELEKIWDKEITPLIQQIITPLNSANILINDDDGLAVISEATEQNLIELLNARIVNTKLTALSPKEQQEDLTKFILGFLKIAVVDRVANKQIPISETLERQLKENFVDAIVQAQKAQKTAIKLIEEKLDDFFKGPLGTVSYINHRDPLGNYSEFKLLFEHNDTFLKPLKVLANAGLSFYHRPDRTMNQQKVRDFNVAVSLEGKTRSPFTEEENLSQITYSFTGRYTRMLENKNLADRKADLANFQVLVDVPLFRGLILPVSVTYSNATELERKQGVRFNFGLKLDTDKLFEILQFNRRFQ